MEEIIKLTSENFKVWLSNHGLEWASHYSELILLIAFCSGLFPSIFKLIKYFYQVFQTKKLTKDLHPFYDYQTIKQATKFYIPTKCQNITPTKEYEPIGTHAFITKEPLLPFFLNKAFDPKNDEQRFYLILADSGMGKTTFMLNLYLRYTNKFFGDKFKMKIFPLGFPKINDEIQSIPPKEQEETILLLDAFDEDPQALENHLTRFESLMDLVGRFREVVITCRTQFFKDEEEEPKESGVAMFNTSGNGILEIRKLYISPFDDRDVTKYLNKKYPIWNLKSYFKRKKAKDIVARVPNLMVRPMLLSYVDELLDLKEIETLNPMKIYELLIEKWILREANRLPTNRRAVFIKNLYLFSEKIAQQIYINHLNKKGLFTSFTEICEFADKHSIELSDMELKGRSLLNRDGSGRFKFAHKSILEYFLAREMSMQKYVNISFLEQGLDQAFKFNLEMLGIELNKIKIFEKFGNEVGFAEEKNKLDEAVKKLNNELNINFSIGVVEGEHLYDACSKKPIKIL